MEQHEDHPTTTGAEDPWELFSGELKGLGSHLRRIHREVAGEEGPDEDQIKDAFTTLAGTWDHVAATASVALRDESARDSLKRTAGALAAALGATLTGLSDQFAEEE